MSNKLAVLPQNVNDVMNMAETLALATTTSENLRGKAADIYAIVSAGMELGLAPMAALRSIHIIKNKPVLSADLMVALVLASGQAEYFTRVEQTDTSVTYETKRKGAPPQRCTWTLAMAKAANLTGKTDGNWAKYPRQMLQARAKAELARDVYPDAVAGCYTPDEATSFGGKEEYIAPPRSSDNVIEAEIVEPNHEPPLSELLAAAPSSSTLEALRARYRFAKAGELEDELVALKARIKEVKAALDTEA